MPIPINDAAFEYLLARAGLTLTDAEKAELKSGLCRHRRDGRTRAQAARPHGRAGADLRLRRGGSVMSRRDPDDRRGRPADRRKAALAGRADPRLPRPRACARRPAARLCPSDRGARAGRGARRRGGDHGAAARRGRCTASRSASRTSSTPRASRRPASRSCCRTTFPTPTPPAPRGSPPPARC